VSRARGNRLQNALAGYLTRWFPHAESAGAGRNGTDVLGTPGIVWECKTANDFKRDFRPSAWVQQAINHINPKLDGDMPSVPVVVYYPPGVGEQNTGNALAIVPLHVLMRLLVDGDYAREPTVTNQEATV
jgi:hypothetical protein